MNLKQQEVNWSADLLAGDWANGEGSGNVLHRDCWPWELPQTHTGSQWRRCGTFSLSPPSHTISETTVGKIHLAHLFKYQTLIPAGLDTGCEKLAKFYGKKASQIRVCSGFHWVNVFTQKLCQYFPMSTSKTLASLPSSILSCLQTDPNIGAPFSCSIALPVEHFFPFIFTAIF